MVVLDIGLARATVIDPDLEPARAIALPGTLLRARALAWPRIVAVGLVPGADHGFHVLDLSSDRGVVGASFGAGNPVPNHPPPFFLGSVAVGLGGRIWTTDGYRYVVQEWTEDGTLVTETHRRPDWFVEPSEWLSICPERPPEPVVVGLHIDAEQRRWITAHRAAPRWREAWPPEQPGAAAVSIASLDATRLYETVLEVIGPGDVPELLAVAILPGHVTTILSDGTLAAYAETTNGAPAIHLLRVDVGK